MAAFKYFVSKINIKHTGHSQWAVLPNSEPSILMNLSVRDQLVSTETSQMWVYSGGTLSEASQSQRHEDT